jgi:hypothetical protein
MATCGEQSRMDCNPSDDVGLQQRRPTNAALTGTSRWSVSRALKSTYRYANQRIWLARSNLLFVQVRRSLCSTRAQVKDGCHNSKKKLAVSISKVLRLIGTPNVGHYMDSSFLLRGNA